jgi:soluble cytochrome b562
MPGACRKRAEALGLHDRHIFFYEQWVPYHQRADFLLEATIAVSLHRDHLETDYAAVRSRILDHLWAGLPSIVSAGGAAAELLTDAGAGLVVPPGDHEAVARALLLLLHDPEQRTAQSLAARERARTLTWEQVAGPLVRFCRAPRRTRPDADTLAIQTARPQPAPPPALAPTAGEVPEPASESLATLEACRNAALAVQEQTWQVQEQPVVRGRFNRLRQFLINQIVRPFLAPLIEQQQTYNAAVLRSMYAMNEATDQRYSTLIHWMNRRIGDIQQEMNDRFRDALEHIQGVRQHLRGVEQFSCQVEQYAQGVYRNSQDVHRYAQGIEQYVHKLEQYARTLEQRLQESEQSLHQSFHQSLLRAGEDTRRVEDYTRRVEDYTRRVEDYTRQVEHQAQDLNQRSLELAMRVEKLKVNDLLFRQQFTDIAEQLAGLEDTDSQLMALWRGENAPLPVKEMTFDTREPPVSPGQTVAEAPPPDEPAATAREASLQERTRLAQQATPPPDEPSAAPAETEGGEGKKPPDQPAPAPKKRTTTGKRTSTRSRTRKPPGSKSTDQ